MKRVLLAGSAVLLLAVIAWAVWPSDSEVKADGDQTQDAVEKQLLALETQGDTGDGGRHLLRGHVLDGENKPVPGAKVEIWRESQLSITNCTVCGTALIDDGDPVVARQLMEAMRAGKLTRKSVAQTVSGADGAFEIEAPSGAVTVYANNGALDGWEDLGDGEEELELVLDPVRVSHLLVITGEEEEHPVGGARLFVASRDTLRFTEVVTDSNGHANVSGLEGGGGLWVFAEAKGFGGQVLPLISGDGPNEDGSTDDERLRLMPARALIVHTTAGGKPIDATVTVTNTGHPKIVKAKNGEAKFDELTNWDIEVNANIGPLTAPKKIISLDQDVTTLEIELRAASRVLLTVIDEGGQPSPSSIILNGEDDQLDATSTESGDVVTLGPMPEGVYTLTVTQTGFRAVERELDLKPGDNTVEVMLHKASGIKGQVVDEKGQGVPGVSVEAHIPPGAPSVASTDGTGHFELEIEEPGPVDLKASQPETGRADAHVNAPNDQVVLHLLPHARLKVHVTDPETGKPAERAMVLINRRGSQEAALQTDETGTVSFAGLEAGDVEASAILQRMTSPSKHVTLEEGRVMELSLAVDPGLRANGVVVDQAGKPVKGITVMTQPSSNSGETDDEGKFELDSLEANVTYTIEVSDDAMDTAAPVTFKAGQTGQVRVVLSPRPKIGGRAVDSTGAVVTQFDIEGNSIEAADGRFDVPARVSEGNTFLVVGAKDHKTYTYEGPYKRDLGDVVLDGARDVFGVVVDAEGKPVSGAVVTPSNGESSVTTGSTGAFKLKLLEDADTISAKRGQAKGSVPIEFGRELRISLAGATHLTGKVLDTKGQPVTAVVTAKDSDGNGVKAESAADGRFSIELASGPWVFSTRLSMAGQLVQVQGATMDITLGAPPGTCGVVVKADGPLTSVVLLPGELGDDDLLSADTKEGSVVIETYGAKQVRAAGLACGTYTLFASFMSETARKVVQVRSQELAVDVAEPMPTPEQPAINPKDAAAVRMPVTAVPGEVADTP